MELLLIRHALPVRRELTSGAADPELSPIGLEQSSHLARYLSTEQLDAVYSSPLRRAVQTAEPLTATRGLTRIEINGVAEWDQNSPEYVPIEELKASNDPRWQAMLNGDWESDESAESFHSRVFDTIESLIGAHRGGRIAVVCHGGVINSYLAQILDLSIIGNGFFYPNYTSIHRVAAASSGQRSVVTLNETSHLRGTGLPMGLFQHGDDTAQ
jgi:probable phosphoglycerate mutase